MKCQNCSSAEYQDGLDTCIENGVKHRIYICPVCDDIFTERIIPVKPNRRVNRAKFIDSVGLLGAMTTIFVATFYILTNLDKFTTIF